MFVVKLFDMQPKYGSYAVGLVSPPWLIVGAENVSYSIIISPIVMVSTIVPVPASAVVDVVFCVAIVVPFVGVIVDFISV